MELFELAAVVLYFALELEVLIIFVDVLVEHEILHELVVHLASEDDSHLKDFSFEIIVDFLQLVAVLLDLLSLASYPVKKLPHVLELFMQFEILFGWRYNLDDLDQLTFLLLDGLHPLELLNGILLVVNVALELYEFVFQVSDQILIVVLLLLCDLFLEKQLGLDLRELLLLFGQCLQQSKILLVDLLDESLHLLVLVGRAK